MRVRRSGHDPGRALADVAVAIADSAETISDVRALADQPGLHGLVASTATVWRVLDGVNAVRLEDLRRAGAHARERAWTARGELIGVELPPAGAALLSPIYFAAIRTTPRGRPSTWSTAAARSASPLNVC